MEISVSDIKHIRVPVRQITADEFAEALGALADECPDWVLTGTRRDPESNQLILIFANN